VSEYTYRLETIRCGKPNCWCAEGEGHGPYWYAYWRDDRGRLRKTYIGKKKPKAGSLPKTAPRARAPLPKTRPKKSRPKTLLSVIRAQTNPRLGMAFVPDVVRACGGGDVRAAHQALMQAARRGEIELRPESGLSRLSREELALCLHGPQGSVLSWIRLP
jgi:hypothetical protein